MKKYFMNADQAYAKANPGVTIASLDLLQLQDRIMNAVIDATNAGMTHAYVSTAQLSQVDDAIAPFIELGYQVSIEKVDGLMGENLLRLPLVRINVDWENA